MTEQRDPLDRLADLSLPTPDEARMRADLARARAHFVANGLPEAAKPARQTAWARWFSPLRLGLAGSSVTAGLIAFALILPSGPVTEDYNRNASAAGTSSAPPALAGAAPELDAPAADMAPTELAAAPEAEIALPAPSARAAEKSASAATPESSARMTEAVPAPPAAPSTTLPPLGAKPRSPNVGSPGIGSGGSGNTALVDLEREEPQDSFSGSDSFSISADQSGIWFERGEEKLEVPIHETPADMTLRMTEMFVLPARNGFPQMLVLRGQQGETLSWQVFRVDIEAVTYDKVITELVKSARTPGQVEGMIGRLPPPD